MVKNPRASSGDTALIPYLRVRKIPLEEEMASRCSILARETLWTEEHGGLQSTESQRVGHDSAHRHVYNMCL